MNEDQFNTLTPEEERVIVHKGTERPYTGEYDNFFLDGTYICRRCNTPLYESKDKFHSGYFTAVVGGLVLTTSYLEL